MINSISVLATNANFAIHNYTQVYVTTDASMIINNIPINMKEGSILNINVNNISIISGIVYLLGQKIDVVNGSDIVSASFTTNCTTFIPNFTPVIEDTPRISTRYYISAYTGTVRTVGSGKTYATLTAAYAAASSGDIIEVYGTINLNSETGGYWLINTAKSVLVRGSTSNASDTILDQSTAGSFGVRVRVNSGIVFKDLTIRTNQNLPCIYNDADEANRNQICDNVRFIQNGTGSSAKYIEPSGVNTSQTRYFEFKNCYFEKLSGNTLPMNITLPSPNNTFLFTGCSFNNSGNNVFRFHQTYDGNVIFYDCNFTQRSSHLVCQFGYDTTIPTVTVGLVDFRGNTIRFTNGSVQHGLLLGRGTDNVKCYNNQIYMTGSSSSLGLGIVLKTTSTNIGNSIIKGNFVYAPRPFYIKGGSKTINSYNIFISNYNNGVNWEAFGFSNHKDGGDEVLSRYNVIKYNTFISDAYGVLNYSTGAVENDDITLKTCEINNNQYYISSGRYLFNSVSSTTYTWDNRTTFYTGITNNELYSTRINCVEIPDFTELIN